MKNLKNEKCLTEDDIYQFTHIDNVSFKNKATFGIPSSKMKNQELPQYIEEEIKGLSKQKFDTVFIGDYIKNKSNKPFNFNCEWDVIEEEVMKRIYNTLGVSEKLLDTSTSTSAVSNKLQLEQFEKAIEKMKSLPPVVIRLEVFPEGYHRICESISVMDTFRKTELHNRDMISSSTGYMCPFNGVYIMVIEKDDELKYNQGRLIYSDGSNKIIELFEVK